MPDHSQKGNYATCGLSAEVERSPDERILSSAAFAAGEDRFTTGQVALKSV
jgi:hypothetical protein